jgi:DNA-binding CsgD family transcriptional regulator
MFQSAEIANDRVVTAGDQPVFGLFLALVVTATLQQRDHRQQNGRGGCSTAGFVPVLFGSGPSRVKCENGWAEATGNGSPSSTPLGHGRSVRVPLPDLRSPAVFTDLCSTSSWPEELVHRRYNSRLRKLTPPQQDEIRSLASSKSLRSLAADFGVSHETIRAIVRGNKERLSDRLKHRG